MTSVSETVRSQYEDLPYPYRDPEDEKDRILLSVWLDGFNHECFAGARDFTKKTRVLIAGGGTGDAVVVWAEILRNNPHAEIVYLDFSSASREVAEKRIKIRGLEKNVKFITDSLLNIPKLNLGEFDVINCSGVLHHLEDPNEGLKALEAVLHEDGVMNIMVYGSYGRIGIYPMQRIMRYINSDSESSQEKINNTKVVLDSLPANNLFMSNLKMIEDWQNDAEIYDIFLHSRDRAYTVPEIYEFAEGAGLKVLNFSPNSGMNKRDEYSAEKYIGNKKIAERVKKLPIWEQQAIAEVMNSRMNKHNFNLVKKLRAPIELGLDMIPNFSCQLPPGLNQLFSDHVGKCEDVVSISMLGLSISFMKTQNLQAILAAIDGKTSLRHIFQGIIKKNKAATLNGLLTEFRPLYNELENCQWLFLRKVGIPEYENITEVHKKRFGGHA